MEKINFEKSLIRLEEITKELESGNLSLDDSLKIFEEGIKLSRFCEKKLTEAGQKLEILKSSDLEINDISIDENCVKENSSEKENDIIIEESEKNRPRKSKKKKNEEVVNINEYNEEETYLFWKNII